MASRPKPEAKLKKLIRDAIPDAHWQIIETWRNTAGVPDMNGCLGGTEVWIETKIWPRKLTPKQANWLVKRYEAGGNTFIAMQRGDSIKVWRGCYARQVVKDGWTADEINGVWLPNLKDEHPQTLRKTLFGRHA